MEFESLIGRCHLGAYICAEWELRITDRCMTEDLGCASGTPFEDLPDDGAIRAFKKNRSETATGTRQVSPLTQGMEVWVLSAGAKLRGGTWYEPVDSVIWLVAVGPHKSGQPNDFFPYCKALDADGRLAPTIEDVTAMLLERDARIMEAIAIEGPLVLQHAREAGHEVKVRIGHQPAAIGIEAAAELEAITVAFDAGSLDFDLVPIILQAIQPGEWDVADSMPSRALVLGEVAFESIAERE
jgi:hypothetical protein